MIPTVISGDLEQNRKAFTLKKLSEFWKLGTTGIN